MCRQTQRCMWRPVSFGFASAVSQRNTRSFCLSLSHLFISLPCLRGDKESWIRSKYVEKKFIQKLPETGHNPLLRRSSARRNRATTQDHTAPRPALKPKPNRATLPRVTGKPGAVQNSSTSCNNSLGCKTQTESPNLVI